MLWFFPSMISFDSYHLPSGKCNGRVHGNIFFHFFYSIKYKNFVNAAIFFQPLKSHYFLFRIKDRFSEKIKIKKIKGSSFYSQYIYKLIYFLVLVFLTPTMEVLEISKQTLIPHFSLFAAAILLNKSEKLFLVETFAFCTFLTFWRKWNSLCHFSCFLRDNSRLSSPRKRWVSGWFRPPTL